MASAGGIAALLALSSGAGGAAPGVDDGVAAIEDVSPHIDERQRVDLDYFHDENSGVAIDVFSSVASDYVNAAQQTCFRVSHPSDHGDGAVDPVKLEGCWDSQVVAAGHAYFRYGIDSGYVFGVAPPDAAAVRINGEMVAPRPSGVWMTEFDGALSDVIVVCSHGDDVVTRVGQPPRSPSND